MTSENPVILAIIDGWGESDNKSDKNNPFSQAKTQNIDFLMKNYPNAKLSASGQSVGLPEGQVGNSEVGHMTIGSGRVILQDLLKINRCIDDHSIEENLNLKDFVKKIKEKNNICHVMGLASDGGVHSHIDHLIWFVSLMAEEKIFLYLHLFLDGRDSIINSQGKYLKYLLNHEKLADNFQIATISGRYYAMDRDQRWERTNLAYNAIFKAEGQKFSNYQACLDYHNSLDINDEFFIPSVIGSFTGIKAEDSIFSFNFRSDRIRQILEPLINENFTEFDTIKITEKFNLLTMSHYSKRISEKFPAILSRESQNDILGEIISKNSLTQLRLAETEKYAHVTFFMNNGKEEAFQGEERILIDSPKIATYDLKPEMSAYEVTEALLTNIDKYDVIILNFANLDMVGHTGNFASAVKAIEVIDECLGKIIEKVKSLNGCMLISSDHGNIEQIRDFDGMNHTRHTENLVPVILFSEKFKHRQLRDGDLTDLAPTMLDLLNIKKPQIMTGKSLLLQ